MGWKEIYNSIPSKGNVAPDILPAPATISGAEEATADIKARSAAPSGLLGRALDLVSRPGYAVTNVIRDAVNGGNFNPLQSAWNGLVGKEKAVMSDVFTTLGWRPESMAGKIAKGIIGFAGDVVTDPTNYINPFSLIGKAAKATDAIITGGKLLKGGQYILDKAIFDVGVRKVFNKPFSIEFTKQARKFKNQEVHTLATLFKAMPKTLGDPHLTNDAKSAFESMRNGFLAQATYGRVKEEKRAYDLLHEFDDTTQGLIANYILRGIEGREVPGFEDIIKVGKGVEKPLSTISFDDFISKNFLKKEQGYIDKTKIATLFDIPKKFDGTEKEFITLIRNKGFQGFERNIIGRDGITLFNDAKYISDSDIKKIYDMRLGNKSIEETYALGKQLPLQEGIKNKLTASADEIRNFIRENIEILKDKIPQGVDKEKLLDVSFEIAKLRDMGFIDKVNMGLLNIDDYRRGYFPVLYDFNISLGSSGMKIKLQTPEQIKKFEEISGAEQITDVEFIMSDFLEKNAVFKVKNQFINEATEKFGKTYQIEDFLKMHKDFNPSLVDDIFKIDDGEGLYIKKYQTEFGNKQYSKEFGVPFQNIVEVLQKVSEDDLIRRAKAGERLPYTVTKMSSAIAHDINGMFKFWNSPDEMSAFWSGLDIMTNAWKRLTLFYPGYPVKNAVGEYFKQWLIGGQSFWHAGINNSEAMKVAQYLWALDKGLKPKDFPVIIAGKTKMVSNMVDDINKSGIRSGFFTEEFTRFRSKNKIAQKLGGFTRFIQNRGKEVEDVMRIGTYLDTVMRKGKSLNDAVKQVKKVHYDYSDFTGVEQQYLRKLIPFYAWQRRNIPAMINAFFEHPEKFSFMNKAKLEIAAQQRRENDKDLPDWMRARYQIKIGETKKGNSRYLDVDLPFNDLNNIFNWRNAVTSSNPLLKAVFEVVANKNLFTGADLADSSLPSGERTREAIKQEFTNNIRPLAIWQRATQENRNFVYDVLQNMFGFSIRDIDIQKERIKKLKRERVERKALERLNK